MVIWRKFFILIILIFLWSFAHADLDDVKKRGVLRHIGVINASFVLKDGGGLDAEVMRLFAKRLQVNYQYINANWENSMPYISGKLFRRNGNKIMITGKTEVRGDVLAAGIIMLPWRKEVAAFSVPVFPSQVWLLTGSSIALKPITPSGMVEDDINNVKTLLSDISVMGKLGTCLDPYLYGLEKKAQKIIPFEGSFVTNMVLSLLNGKADAILLGVPDAFMVMTKWSGSIKVIGPISPQQEIAFAFAKESPKLLAEFNNFFYEISHNGVYLELVKKYYSSVIHYFPEFFERIK